MDLDLKKIIIFLVIISACILTMCGGYAAAAPVASFTTNVTDGIAPLSVQSNDTSTGRILSWSWNFGNGVTSTLQNPTYIYTLAGKYTVVETVDGVRSQRCCEIIITVLPTYKNIKQSFANITAPEPPGSLGFNICFNTSF